MSTPLASTIAIAEKIVRDLGKHGWTDADWWMDDHRDQGGKTGTERLADVLDAVLHEARTDHRERVKALRLGPDDILVIESDECVSPDAVQFLADQITEAGIKNKVMFMEKFRVKVIKQKA